jgi:dTDP-4-amino-4,6-dideoxygalactose transaminase
VQPVFAEFSAGDFPIAADLCARHVCLPVHAAMKDEDAQYVVSSISKCLKDLLKGTLV